ncbi:MAG: hypothetical protein AAF383_10415 [Cyanobacteria bacterium P01_A01_bin.83]
MHNKNLVPVNTKCQSTELTRIESSNNSREWLITAIVINAAIGCGALFLLQFLTPTFASRGAVIIPGVGSQGSVELSETGKTSDAPNQTPYSYLLRVDPRENYYYIARTEAVLARAAAAVDMTLEEFGIPNIGLINKTSIIEFEIDGKTAEESQQKAWAFYRAWDEHISSLREAQALLQNESIKRELDSVNSQLKATQEKISEFRSQSPLQMATQIEELVERTEDLRIEHANLLDQKKGADARFRQLSNQLNLTAKQASDALILLDDKVFQTSLQNYSDAVAKLEILSSKWSADSPQVRIEEDQKQTSQRAILNRSRALLGRTINLRFLSQLNLAADGRKDLVEELVRLQVEREGLASQSQTKQQQIEQFESRLKTLTQEKFLLSRLEREAQISESIFTGGVAQLDVNKPEFATNYPPFQLIKKPSLPLASDQSQSRRLILGALSLSFVSTTGLLMIWWEKRQNKALSFNHNESNLEAINQ